MLRNMHWDELGYPLHGGTFDQRERRKEIGSAPGMRQREDIPMMLPFFVSLCCPSHIWKEANQGKTTVHKRVSCRRRPAPPPSTRLANLPGDDHHQLDVLRCRLRHSHNKDVK